MSLQISDTSLNKFDLAMDTNFDEVLSSFVLTSPSIPSQLYIKFPFNRYEDEVANEYEIFIFTKQDFKLNDIYPVHLDELKQHDKAKGRIGWIFPLQVLLEDHSQLNIYESKGYTYFNKYLYVAIKKLLVSQNLPSLIPNINLSEINKLNLLSFYTENCQVLILSKKRVSECDKQLGRKFNIEQCLPFLYSYGYNYINTPSSFKDIAEKERDFFLEYSNKNLFIKRLSADLDEENFILSLFKGPLAKENNPVFIFHSLYQVIEILIQKIFDCELMFFPSKFTEEKSNFYKIKEKLDTLTKENYRVQLLFTEYLEVHNEFVELKDGCIHLLKACSKFDSEADSEDNKLLEDIKNKIFFKVNSDQINLSEKNRIKGYIGSIIDENIKKTKELTTSRLFYKTRSLIFHEFKAIPEGYDLTKLNKSFMFAILVIILEFKLKKLTYQSQPAILLAHFKTFEILKIVYQELVNRVKKLFKK